MVRMISKRKHEYAGRRLSEGDPFDCEDKHVVFMELDGRAQVDDEKPAPQETKNRDMSAADGGEYLTRDMSAKRKNNRAKH